MSRADEISALAAICKATVAGGSDLDRLISEAFGGKDEVLCAWSRSVGDALSLIPAPFAFDHCVTDRRSLWRVCLVAERLGDLAIQGTGATLALAICAASLMAMREMTLRETEAERAHRTGA